MKKMKLKLSIVCIVVGGLVGLMASPAVAVTVISQSANTDIFLGLPFNDLEFENPLTGTEMIKEYAVLEWRDADYAPSSPPWYDDWTVSDPTNIDGNINEIWMRQRDQSISTATTVASNTVSIHLVGDNNDGLAEVLVDGSLVARLNMYTPSLPAQTALIIVKDLANTPHTITVKDLGPIPGGPTGADDVATMGAAALEKRIKWSQPPVPVPTEPDNLYYGWNEISDYNGRQIVADDWQCENEDPITDIHWWGSFQGWTDSFPPQMPDSFHITIWNDIPDLNPYDPHTFSHPNEVVWEIDCSNFQGSFVGWDYDPRTKSYEACFYFEQYLTPSEYFFQRPQPGGTEPAIYWISIAARYPAGTIVDNPWGWKTRPRIFNDDAVRIFKPTNPHMGDSYRYGEPIYWPDPNQSWDMAFELTAQSAGTYPKWEQLPDPCLPGLHCHDSATLSWTTIADDWKCDGGVVSDLHWYGNYENKGLGISHFHLSIHKPDPDNPCLPDPMEAWGIDVPFTALSETDTSLVNSDGARIYKYEYDLATPFPQEQYQNYWFDISAYSVDPMNPAIWRWQESARTTMPTLCGAASRIDPMPGQWQTITWGIDPVRYSDMAFAVTSPGVGEMYVKWSQRPEPYTPDAYSGWNEISWYNGGQIAADDWFCETDSPVTDIHWWGSYLGWSCEDEPPLVPDSFHIAIWTDVPLGVGDFSHPNEVIWETDCNNFTCEFVGWDIDPREPYAPPEACFKFEQDIPEKDWFDQQPGGNIYWISIAAKYPVGTYVPHLWGWKTRPRDPRSLAPDDAVMIWDPTAPKKGDWFKKGAPIWWPTWDDSWDLAFELTTEEKPPKEPVPHLKWSQPPIEINPVGQPVSYKLYATTFQAVDQLISINPGTGAGTLIGNMTTGGPFGLSDRGTELWTFDMASDSNSMIRLDPATGNTLQKIVLNPPGLTGEGGVAFRSDGIGFLTSAKDAAGQLWSFDITVPSSTYIGAFQPSMDGLDLDGSDALYGLKQGSSMVADTYELYIIDQATGATTFVGDTGITVTSTVAGLTFAPDGTLFAALRDPLNPNTWSLYELDKGTGAATLIGPIGFSGISGLTALPVSTEPTLPIYCGWDEPSWVGVPMVGHPEVADDFRCLGSMPITSIHWWGSYEGWDSSEPPPMRPIAWWFKFWSNVPAHPTTDPNYSHPGEVLWQSVVDANLVHSEWVGYDSFPEKPSEASFQYYVDLKPDEIFWQADFKDKTIDDIFWLGIVALYPQDIMNVTNPWGWKTRPWSWMDDAVSQQCREVQPGVIYCGFWPIEDIFGKSFDVAFELDTDPNWIKAEQPFTGIRNWPHYEDELSMATVQTITEVVTKWIQQPDPTERGMDVDATDDDWITWPPQVLADDFLCEMTGPITDIHIWGSWYHDLLPYDNPTNVWFTLSIHDNNPAGPGGWSEPIDPPLWVWDFGPGEFEAWLSTYGQEGYYVPCIEYYEPFADTVCWRYDFDIDRDEAFVQKEGRIYWLNVQAYVQPNPGMPEPVRFGWKTSMEQRLDDAVWAVGWDWDHSPWEELHHPETLESLDLAFELTTETEKTELVIDRLVADDWKCERRTPVTAAVWWGSYIGYQYKPCYGQDMALPVKPDYFWLALWIDVPANVDSTVPFSHPNEIIWEYKAYDYDEVLVGFDKHPLSIPGTEPLGREPVFRYSVRLPEDNWFLQKDVNDIYWFSVVAVYEDPLPVIYPWGWTNHKHVFNDDAVAGVFDPPAGWFWQELYDQNGDTEDMSFMLFTDPDECVSCADYNSDSIVNFIDYADFADDWRWIGPAGGYNNSDLNCNGIVDFNDLDIFTQQWLSSCP